MKSKQHDFHLVDPSPWPIAISAAIIVFVLGLVSTMHKQLFGISALVFGAVGVFYVLFY